MQYSFTFSPDALALIKHALGRMPYGDVAALIAALEASQREQEEARQKAQAEKIVQNQESQLLPTPS